MTLAGIATNKKFDLDLMELKKIWGNSLVFDSVISTDEACSYSDDEDIIDMYESENGTVFFVSYMSIMEGFSIENFNCLCFSLQTTAMVMFFEYYESNNRIRSVSEYNGKIEDEYGDKLKSEISNGFEDNIGSMVYDVSGVDIWNLPEHEKAYRFKLNYKNITSNTEDFKFGFEKYTDQELVDEMNAVRYMRKANLTMSAAENINSLHKVLFGRKLKLQYCENRKYAGLTIEQCEFEIKKLNKIIPKLFSPSHHRDHDYYVKEIEYQKIENGTSDLLDFRDKIKKDSEFNHLASDKDCKKISRYHIDKLISYTQVTNGLDSIFKLKEFFKIYVLFGGKLEEFSSRFSVGEMSSKKLADLIMRTGLNWELGYDLKRLQKNLILSALQWMKDEMTTEKIKMLGSSEPLKWWEFWR